MRQVEQVRFPHTLLCRFGRCGLFTFLSLGPNSASPLPPPAASQALQRGTAYCMCVHCIHLPWEPLPLPISISKGLPPTMHFLNSCAKFLLSPPPLRFLLVAQTKPRSPKCNLGTFRAGFHELNESSLIKIFQHGFMH